ncbi:hypothetical protein V1506DRAFT_104279 [Lipomyces tetrasporus]
MDSVKVFVDNVDTFLSRIPSVIAQQISSSKTGHAHTSIRVRYGPEKKLFSNAFSRLTIKGLIPHQFVICLDDRGHWRECEGKVTQNVRQQSLAR